MTSSVGWPDAARASEGRTWTATDVLRPSDLLLLPSAYQPFSNIRATSAIRISSRR
jgi:hypothetical protein